MHKEIADRMKRGCSDLLSNHIYDNGPTSFVAEEVEAQSDLFAHRAALYYTHAANIPDEWIGRGDLDVRLTVPTPDYLEFQEVRSYAIPRLWVDLLQRATHRIRWAPVRPAYVIFTRFDCNLLRDDHLAIGMKALRDALKASTTGREDGRLLYYFGAIYDDDDTSAKFVYQQVQVDSAAASGMRIQVSGESQSVVGA